MGFLRMMEVARWKILEYPSHRLCNLPTRALVSMMEMGLVLVLGMRWARILRSQGPGLAKPRAGLNGWGGEERRRRRRIGGGIRF